MGKNKIGLNIQGFEELIGRLEAVDGSIKEVTESALKASKSFVTKQVESAISKHKRTGRTIQSLDKDYAVTWDGTTGSIGVGFDIQNGGMASIFLMYGTPRHPKNHPGTPEDSSLYNAIYGSKTKKEISRIQTEAFEKIIERLGG